MKIILKLMNVVIVLMTLFVIAAAMMVVEEYTDFGYNYGKSSYLYRLEEYDYSDGLNMLRDQYGYEEVPEDMRTVAAVFEYFEAKSLHTVYVKNNQDRKADYYRQLMDLNSSRMGEFIGDAKIIDNIFDKYK